MTITEITDFIVQEASETIRDYNFGRTEVEGCKRIALAVGVTAFSVFFLKRRDPDNPEMQEMANEAIIESVRVAASGCIKLSVVPLAVV